MERRAPYRHNAQVPRPLHGATQTWRPLLTDTDAERAREAIDDIADALRDPGVTDIDAEIGGMGVAGGTSGAALFFAQIGDEKTALDFLDRALASAAEELPSLPLYVGTTGVGWVLSHLEGSILDPEEGPNDVDELVEAGLRSPRWKEFDLIRGIAGLGVYLLERGLPTDGLVAALERTATETDQGHTWWVDPTTVPQDRAELFPNGYYDVGLAHGQAGVVSVLALALAAGDQTAKPFLESTLRWMRAQRLPEDKGPGRYPLLFGPGDEPGGGRMAWCYGDIGVATALLAAGKALKDDDVLAEARSLAIECAEREPSRAGVLDASLCHGSGGLALLFARLAHAFDDERLAEAARTWGRVLLDQRMPGEPVGGIQYSMPIEGTDDRGLQPRAGLLEGAAGAGLVLHALTTDKAPDWDLLFLTRPVS